jgi:hypothetical protein
MKSEFAHYQRKAPESTKEMFIKRMSENENLVCNLIDADVDGVISNNDHIDLFESTEC